MMWHAFERPQASVLLCDSTGGQRSDDPVRPSRSGGILGWRRGPQLRRSVAHVRKRCERSTRRALCPLSVTNAPKLPLWLYLYPAAVHPSIGKAKNYRAVLRDLDARKPR